VQIRKLFESDGIGQRFHQHFLGKERCNWCNLRSFAKRIANGNGFRIARQGNDVTFAKGSSGLDDLPADIGKNNPVPARIEILVPSCILNGLEGDAANAFPLQRIVDDLTQLVIVHAALHHHYERGRN